MLPFATKSGETTTLSGSFFTTVSATCVTGLVVYDTWKHWSVFGQLVILGLIQVGGLGIITIDTFLMTLLRRRISDDQKELIHESLSTFSKRGGPSFVRRIIGRTAVIEFAGALILAIRFIPEMGVERGIYYGIFHSISAFCNAGFDLMGYQSPYVSLTGYTTDPVVILTISALIIIGGLGFIVWDDLSRNKFHAKRYNVHTKIVLSTTCVLLVAGTILFFLFEKDELFSGYSTGGKWLAAFFSAVTPRTAGFNSVDTASLSGGSTFLTIILMFIGGSPGSTAGGVKTTTFLIVLLFMDSYLVRSRKCVIFKHYINFATIRKASAAVFINFTLAATGAFVILGLQDLAFKDVIFEVFSAIGTAGMSTGVTRSLGLGSEIVIMILMFAGRMGSLSFAMSLVEEVPEDNTRYPLGRIAVG